MGGKENIVETDYDYLLAYLADTFIQTDNRNLTPEAILDILIQDRHIANLWIRVYDSRSPVALEYIESARLITDIYSLVTFSLDRSDDIIVVSEDHKNAMRKLSKQRSKETYRIRKHEKKEDRRQDALDFIRRNPRRFGNGKNDETYPEYYGYPTRIMDY